MHVRAPGFKIATVIFAEHFYKKRPHRSGPGLAGITVNQQGISIPVQLHKIQNSLCLLLCEQYGALYFFYNVVKLQRQYAFTILIFLKAETKPAGMTVLYRNHRIGVCFLRKFRLPKGIIVRHHIFKRLMHRTYQYSFHRSSSLSKQNSETKTGYCITLQ